jgi:hypothetical protein
MIAILAFLQETEAAVDPVADAGAALVAGFA